MEAIKCNAEDLRDLERFREKRRNEEIKEQRHKEMIKKLDDITDNQEKINDELETANQCIEEERNRRLYRRY